MKKKTSKIIAPRLSNGERRENSSGGLPPTITRYLKLLARDDNKSVSWIKEQIIIDWFLVNIGHKSVSVDYKTPTTQPQDKVFQLPSSRLKIVKRA